MIERCRGLSGEALEQIAALEARSIAADGGRLKLEWQVLRSRPTDVVTDLLWREGAEVVGFLGLYAFGMPVELAGMVDPSWRRRGIGTALVDAALEVCAERSLDRALLVAPREPDYGALLAQHRGGALEHSEHAMLQRCAPPDGPRDPRLSLRRARPDDVPALSRVLAAAFGNVPAIMARDIDSTDVVERAGEVVGTLRASRDGDTASVYGFAVDPALQGQGIGRDVLRRLCLDLRADGVEQVRLEVAVDNDRALGLYTSLGFERVATEDYWTLPMAG